MKNYRHTGAKTKDDDGDDAPKGLELQKDNGALCGNVQIGLHKGLPGTFAFYKGQKGNNMANKNSGRGRA